MRLGVTRVRMIRDARNLQLPRHCVVSLAQTILGALNQQHQHLPGVSQGLLTLGALSLLRQPHLTATQAAVILGALSQLLRPRLGVSQDQRIPGVLSLLQLRLQDVSRDQMTLGVLNLPRPLLLGAILVPMTPDAQNQHHQNQSATQDLPTLNVLNPQGRLL